MARASDALQRHGDRPRRANLANQIDRADVDAELERRRRDHRLQLALLQSLLGGEPELPRQTAVMRQDGLLAKPFAQMVGNALGEPPRVDEHERGSMLLNQRRNAIVDLRPHLIRRDWSKLVLRNLDREIHGAAMSVINHCHLGSVIRCQEAGNCLDRPDGGG
jgi:hypothetical protein